MSQSLNFIRYEVTFSLNPQLLLVVKWCYVFLYYAGSKTSYTTWDLHGENEGERGVQYIHTF